MARTPRLLARALMWTLVGAALCQGGDIASACGQTPQVDGSSMLQVGAAQRESADIGPFAHLKWSGYGLDPRIPPGAGSELDLDLLMSDHEKRCDTVFLTSLFTTCGGGKGELLKKLGFQYFSRYYLSILSLPGGRAKSVIMYDDLPEDLMKHYATGDGVVSFVRVNVSGKESSTDFCFKVFEEQVSRHPEWENVFITDARDVTVVHNPCIIVEQNPEKLFVGSYPADMELRSKPENKSLPELSSGILGGKRSVVLKALRKVSELVSDSELISTEPNRNSNLLAAAINYAGHTAFGTEQVMTGRPLHSLYGARENRTDVYFWYK